MRGIAPDIMELGARMALAALMEADGDVEKATEEVAGMRDEMAAHDLMPPELLQMYEVGTELLAHVPGDWRLTILNAAGEWREHRDREQGIASGRRRRGVRAGD